MSKINILRKAYQYYVIAKKERYDEILKEKNIDPNETVLMFEIHKDILDQISSEEKQPPDISEDHNVNVPTRRK